MHSQNHVRGASFSGVEGWSGNQWMSSCNTNVCFCRRVSWYRA